MQQIDKYILLFGLMAICLFYVYQFVMVAGDRAKMEKEIRGEYAKMYSDAIDHLPKVIYGCSYSPPESGFWQQKFNHTS
jgi:hypothetical protein